MGILAGRTTLAVAILSSWLSAQAVLGVGPGQQFADIPPAIAAAAPGDHVLVSAGTYSSFTLDKGLLLRADPVGAQVVVNGLWPLPVRCEVPVGQAAVVQGLGLYRTLEVFPPAGANAAGPVSFIDVDSSQNIVVANAPLSLRGCTFLGGGGDGVAVAGTAVLHAVQCTLEGGFHNTLFGAPRHGVVANGQAVVHLSDCTVTGGSQGILHSNSSAGSGVVLFGNATAWLVDSTIRGFPQWTLAGIGVSAGPNASATVERCLTMDSGGQSPSEVGNVQPGLVLGLSTQSTLARGSTFTLDFRTRAALPVVVHAAFDLATPAPHAAIAQPDWGFAQGSLQFGFAIADAQGNAGVSLAIPNSAWLQDVRLWFAGWTASTLPVQLSPVLGGPIQ